MAYASLLVHLVFATKNRQPLIPEILQPALWAYMGGIARKNGFSAIAVGGVADHAHVLIALPTIIPVAKATQLIKAGSSKWLRGEKAQLHFGWQESYGAFTIGVSQLRATVRYIQGQREHHQRRSGEEEWKQILRCHGLEEFQPSLRDSKAVQNQPGISCRA